MSQENSNYIYVRVNREWDFGFWEINTDNQKALFRENSFIRSNPNQPILDYSTLYNTVSGFLQSSDFFMNKEASVVASEHGHVYVKSIIQDRKAKYSKEPFCAYYKLGVDAHDPNTMLVCDKPALIMDQHGNLLCGLHANETFKKKFLPQD